MSPYNRMTDDITKFISNGCPLTDREVEVLFYESDLVKDGLSCLSNKKLLGVRFCSSEYSTWLSSSLALLVEEADGHIFCYFLRSCGYDSQLHFNPHQAARLNSFCRDGSKDLTFIKIFDGASSAYRSNSFNVLFDPMRTEKLVITYSLMLGRETDFAPSPYYVTADFWWLGDDTTDTGSAYEKLPVEKFIQMRRVDLTKVLFEERDTYYSSSDC